MKSKKPPASKRDFIAKTDREKTLLKWMWLLLDKLDDVSDSYVPHATSCEAGTDELVRRIRKRFPELHRKFSKKILNKLTTILHSQE